MVFHITSEVPNYSIENCFDNGLMILKAGKNTLRFLPPLTISKSEIDEGFKRLGYALEKI